MEVFVLTSNEYNSESSASCLFDDVTEERSYRMNAAAYGPLVARRTSNTLEVSPVPVDGSFLFACALYLASNSAGFRRR